MLRVFESFAGIGSQRMALRNLGIDFEVVGICEVDKYALLAYDAIHNKKEYVEEKTKEEMLKEFENKHIGYNFSTNKSEIPKKYEDIKKIYEAHIRSKNYGDIRLINQLELPEIDLFTYSYPCKNISVAGKSDGLIEGSGTQSSLVWECFKIIEHSKPKYLLMENVKNLVGKKHKPQFDIICQKLNDLGYNNYWKVMNGKDYGVPQNRERVIMISIRKDVDNGNYHIPKPIKLNKYVKDLLEENVDDKYYISSDKLIIKNNVIYNPKCEDRLIEIGLLNTKGRESNKRVYHENSLCPTITSMNGGGRQPKILIPQATKQGYIEMNIGGICDMSYPTSKTRRGRVQENGNISPTLTATQQDVVIVENDYKIRKLTPLECWRLMGFKDEDYYKAKEIGLPETKLYERAGRGIVVPMLEEIFKELFKED